MRRFSCGIRVARIPGPGGVVTLRAIASTTTTATTTGRQRSLIHICKKNGYNNDSSQHFPATALAVTVAAAAIFTLANHDDCRCESSLSSSSSSTSSSSSSSSPLSSSSAAAALTSDGKPIYRRSEIAQHVTKEKGVWVTYKNGVYDITKFIANHPGGQDKIILAAGGNVETFWNVYRQHYNSKLAEQALGPLLIGYLHPGDYEAETKAAAVDKANTADPYSADPPVSPVHTFHGRKPINAEAPSTLLSDNWITPSELWFKRNHHPVPKTTAEKYTLTLSGLGVIGTKGEDTIVLTLDDLKTKFKKFTVTSAIQCGGNRRSEMNSISTTAGSPWNVCAISNATWGGARLRDVLKYVGAADEEALVELGAKHVQFTALEGMEASIPLHKALDSYGDVVLAYEMNGEDLPESHGYPVRVIVPGHVGVRNVKWVSKITVSSEEAAGPWQRGMAYKGFGPSLKSLEGVEVEKIPSLQEQPVQSAIMVPRVKCDSMGQIAAVEMTPGPQLIQGYAYSGGGRGIIRVDVSADGGVTWKDATLRTGSEQPLDRAWAWTFWECVVDIPKPPATVQLICKATDASYNVQPETVKGIWNLRGINNNAWHRVNVLVVPEDQEEEESDDGDDDNVVIESK